MFILIFRLVLSRYVVFDMRCSRRCNRVCLPHETITGFSSHYISERSRVTKLKQRGKYETVFSVLSMENNDII